MLSESATGHAVEKLHRAERSQPNGTCVLVAQIMQFTRFAHSVQSRAELLSGVEAVREHAQLLVGLEFSTAIRLDITRVHL